MLCHVRTAAALAGLCAVVSSVALGPHGAVADDRWNPFADNDTARASKKRPPAAETRPMLPSMDGRLGSASADPRAGEPGPRPGSSGDAWTPYAAAPGTAAPRSEPLPPLDLKASAVERVDLTPVLAADGSGMPHGLWQGVDLAQFEQLLSRIEIPPRSPALHGLWRRLIKADSPPGSMTPEQFRALRAEGLYRTGLAREAAELLGSDTGPLAGVLRSRSEIALGKSDVACESVKSVAANRAELPKPVRAEALLMSGLCAGIAGNRGGAGLVAELAREDGVEAPLALAVLDALATGQAPKLAQPKRLSAIDYRLLQLVGPIDPVVTIDRAEPALLASLVADAAGEPKPRLAAAEAAARLNVIEPAALAEIYRAQRFSPEEMADPLTGRPDPLARRALLFKAAEAERTPQKKARLIRALLDDARRNGTYLQTLRLIGRSVEEVPRAPEIGWFAETAIEATLAGARYDAARSWVEFAAGQDRPGGPLSHWLALADIADPGLKGQRGQSLASVEALALRGRFGPDLLHRLATVLDALDYNVPIPLWEAASRTPQPNTGHLPATGVLSELQDAAKKKEFGRTVLLAMQALGAHGAEGAHMIALGDAIRALKRAGLEAEARQIAFEALFAGWPRTVSN